MKLGFVSAILPDLSLEEVLQFAAAERFSCVEVMCWPRGRAERKYADIPSNNFGLNYDPSHFILQQMDPVSPLGEFKDRLFHVHAKDMRVHPERLNEVGIFAFPTDWHSPRIPGFGEVHWAQFMAKLYEIGYDGPVCIEVEDSTFGKTLEGRQRALKVARHVLQPFFT